MNYEQHEHEITLYLLGDLPPERAELIEQLLEESEECRALAQEIELTLGLLRDALADSSGIPVELDSERRNAVFLETSDADPVDLGAEVPSASEKKGLVLRIKQYPRTAANVAALFVAAFISVGVMQLMQEEMPSESASTSRQLVSEADYMDSYNADMDQLLAPAEELGLDDRGFDESGEIMVDTELVVQKQEALKAERSASRLPSVTSATATLQGEAGLSLNYSGTSDSPHAVHVAEKGGKLQSLDEAKAHPGGIVNPSKNEAASDLAASHVSPLPSVPTPTAPAAAAHPAPAAPTHPVPAGRPLAAAPDSWSANEADKRATEQLDGIVVSGGVRQGGKGYENSEVEKRHYGTVLTEEITEESAESGRGEVAPFADEGRKNLSANATRPTVEKEAARSAPSSAVGRKKSRELIRPPVNDSPTDEMPGNSVGRSSEFGVGGGGLNNDDFGAGAGKSAESPLSKPNFDDQQVDRDYKPVPKIAPIKAPTTRARSEMKVPTRQSAAVNVNGLLDASVVADSISRSDGEQPAPIISQGQIGIAASEERLNRISGNADGREPLRPVGGESAKSPAPIANKPASLYGGRRELQLAGSKESKDESGVQLGKSLDLKKFKKAAKTALKPEPKLAESVGTDAMGHGWFYQAEGKEKDAGGQVAAPAQDFEANLTVVSGKSVALEEAIELEGESEAKGIKDLRYKMGNMRDEVAKEDASSVFQRRSIEENDEIRDPISVEAENNDKLVTESKMKMSDRYLGDTEADKYTSEAPLQEAQNKVTLSLEEIAESTSAPLDEREEEAETEAIPAREALTDPKEPSVYRAYSFNSYVDTVANPYSTFAIDVDNAAYTLTRSHMSRGALPPAEAVRTEEFVNFFNYHYPSPDNGMFAVYNEGAPSPFGSGYLLKVGVKGKVVGRDQQRPANLTFVIDTSGSMDTPDRLGLAKQALKLLIGHLGAQDRVAIVQYDFKARLALDHTPASEKRTIIEALDRLQISGSTNLEDGITLGYEVAAKAFNPTGVNQVLLISDGMANLGNADADSILKEVEKHRKQGITCSIFGFGIGNYNDVMLETLANKGDGVYRFIDGMNEAKRVFVDNLSATLNHIASDVKIQVQFNPERVKRYRQIGYENRQLKANQFRDDTVDAGEVGSGQAVTALYEVDIVGDPRAPIGTTRVRYRNLDTGEVEEIEREITVSDLVRDYAETNGRFKLAACVAEFAEILRGSPFSEDSSFAMVADRLRPVAQEYYLDQDIQELVRLVQAAKGMPRSAD